MEITNFQRSLMEHTISDPGRNWFGTSFDCEDSVEFEKLVLAGYASKETPPSWMGDDVIYRLTPEGRRALEEAIVRNCIGQICDAVEEITNGR